MWDPIVEKINETAAYLKTQYQEPVNIAIVLGSGLGNLVQKIKIEKEVAYTDIPNFPVSTVKGHSGKLIFGEVGGKKIYAFM